MRKETVLISQRISWVGTVVCGTAMLAAVAIVSSRDLNPHATFSQPIPANPGNVAATLSPTRNIDPS